MTMKSAELRFIQCKISPGFFDNEFYVIIVENGSAVFVDISKVKLERAPEKGEEVDGLVQAYVIKRKSDQALIELPGEAVVGGLRTWVPMSLLNTD